MRHNAGIMLHCHTSEDGASRRTRIKFCGLRRAVDVQRAVDLGVDAIGLIFARRSRRRIELADAVALRHLVPSATSVVALLMDNPADEVSGIVRELQPDLLQFHGGETAAFCVRTGLPYLRAVPMGDGVGAAAAIVADHPAAWGFVLDSHGAGATGGSGRCFDWRRLPPGLDRPWLLAGGLAAENVGAAIAAARPFAVDVAGGIESAPGIKDARLMKRFVEEVIRADNAAPG